MTNKMYEKTVTWNPFKGCLFDCIYCKPSFQLQARRQKWRCTDCYNFVPHNHPERLNKIPSGETIFACGNGDISFCNYKFTNQIIESIKKSKKNSVFFLQSKRPEYFEAFLDKLPNSVRLLTTLETNRDDNYDKISRAPKPSTRYEQFLNLDYPNKIVTIEPIMDFDLNEFVDMIVNINPMYVWLGLNTRPKQVTLPEPSKEKFDEFRERLKENNINVNFQTVREDFK